MKDAFSELRGAALITAGVLSAGMGLHGFLAPSRFIDGGVTGISMLLGNLTPVPLSVWLTLVNLPFVALGYQQIGKRFAARSVAAIAGLALAVAFIPYPHVTHDLLLTAVFGGVFLGAGIGLSIRGGAVLDGTEIVALLISKKTHILQVGDIILLFNIVLFLCAIWVLGVEPALYSILTYAAAAKTLDFILYGLEQHAQIMIISRASGELRDKLVDDLGRGVTVYKSYGARSGIDQDVLSCVVTRLEIGKVKQIVREVDPEAFVTQHHLTHVEGGFGTRARSH